MNLEYHILVLLYQIFMILACYRNRVFYTLWNYQLIGQGIDKYVLDDSVNQFQL